MSHNPAETRAFLSALFRQAVAAADPRAAIRANLPRRPQGRTLVIAFGKAASSMAAIFEAEWDGPVEGVIVDRHGAATGRSSLRRFSAAHPVPDQAGLAAGQAVLDLLATTTDQDLVVVLASGGGSALLPAPAAGMTFEDEVEVNRRLLVSGLAIDEMNLIRAHLSALKGGALTAAARPARVVTFVASDIPGDDVALVSSGPTFRIRRSAAEALEVVRGRGLVLPPRALARLQDLSQGVVKDLPREDGDDYHLTASAGLSLRAAADEARRQGVAAVILSDALEGEAAILGREQGALARQCRRMGAPYRAPVVLLSGGETTVRLDSEHGEGGRNTEYLLALALEIEGLEGVHALAADTDGIDGSQNNAGAFADGGSVRRIEAAGMSAKTALQRHDAYSAFAAAGDLFVTGPTGTNVNDFRAILIG